MQFQYSDHVPVVSNQLRTLAEEISDCDLRNSIHAHRAGQLLHQGKELLYHGEFSSWCSLEFSWDPSLIRRLMQVSRCFPSEKRILSRFVVSALYLLSRKSTPQSVRSSAIEYAEAGHRVTWVKAKELLSTNRRKPKQAVIAPEQIEDHSITIIGHIAKQLALGGSLHLSVSVDDEEADAIVSAWLKSDDGTQKNIVRSSVATALLAISGLEQTKACTTCGEVKTPEAFSKKGESDRASACKACERKRVQTWKDKKRKAEPSAN